MSNEIAEHIALDSLRHALRFYEAVRADSARLAEFSGLGPIYGFSKPHLADVRFWPIGGFRRHLIFYRAVPDGVEILCVLHGARDIPALMQP